MNKNNHMGSENLKLANLEYHQIKNNIELMLDADKPENHKIFRYCESIMEACVVEIKLRKKTKSFDEFVTLYEEDILSICYYAGSLAFNLSRDDSNFLESAQYYLEILPDGWNLYKHITLAKIYLYEDKLDDALIQMALYRGFFEKDTYTNDFKDVELQYHYENLYFGLAAINYAKDEMVKFYEYFNLYKNCIINNGGAPVVIDLFLTNFLPYFELNGDNLLFLENLLPLCDFVEDSFGVKYDLWIKAEFAYAEGDHTKALDLALQFKASHVSFFEMSGDTVEEGWKMLSEQEVKDSQNEWPTDNFIHPALGSYKHIPIGRRVDDRIKELCQRLEYVEVTKTSRIEV